MEPILKSTKLLVDWTTEEVCEWLVSVSLEALVSNFMKEDISGKVLMWCGTFIRYLS